MSEGLNGLTTAEREELRLLATAAWTAATEGGYLDQLNLMTSDGLADDMISYDADIENFSVKHGYEWVKSALTEMLPEITKNSF